MGVIISSIRSDVPSAVQYRCQQPGRAGGDIIARDKPEQSRYQRAVENSGR